MQRVGSREFKNRLGRYLLAVRKGQTLLITDRGKPVAKVSPPDRNDDSDLTFSEVLKKLEAEGKIRLPKRPLGKFRAIPTRGKPASQMIIEDRR
jgi:prevent-host-death family protein